MNFKTIAYVFGISILFTNLIFGSRAFILAFFNSSYTYTMNVNYFGEGIYEIIMVLLLFPFGLYVLYEKIKEIYVGVKS